MFTVKIFTAIPIFITLCITAHTVPAQEGIETKGLQKLTPDKRFEKEIAALYQQSVIKTAFQTIINLEPETLRDHIMLTEIPAPPFKEDKRAAKFKEMLQAAGADSIWIDKAGNVIALRKGRTGKKTIVIEGHLDTVFPEGTDVTVKHKGDTLMAPGIGDDTRGLTVVLTVLKAMQKHKIKTDADILFIGTTGEEGLGDLRGVKELFSEGSRKIDSYISIDGSGFGTFVTGGVGSHRYRITYKGPGGHSYGSFGLANPHNATARAIYYFVNTADSFTKAGIKTTYNIGMVGGGTSVNAIPFESWMEVDMRSESPERLRGIDSLLQLAVQRALKEENLLKRSGHDLTVDVQLVGDRPSGMQEPSIPLIQRTIAAYTLLGGNARISSSSTNANIPISKGVPAVNIGNGGKGGGAHSLNEWWVNDKGHLAIQHALLLLVAEAGLSKL